MHRQRFNALILLIAVLVLRLEDVAAFEERNFDSGYAGSLPGDPMQLTRTYFNNAHIRELIYEIESGPVSRERVEQALAHTDFQLSDLLGAGVLREVDGRYVIAFNYFTRADMHKIYAVADKYVPLLAQKYLDLRDDFYAIFDRYPAKSVRRDVIAFVLITGMSLNWDGLRYTLESGRRKPNLVRGDGWKYSFWASEKVPERSLKSYFWGSTNLPIGPVDYQFTRDDIHIWYSSFGDGHSDPRMNFPDLFYLPGSRLEPGVRKIAERIGLGKHTIFGTGFDGILGLDLAVPISEILSALRTGPKDPAALVSSIPDKYTDRSDDILALLVETQYVSAGENGLLYLRMPILTPDDRAMVDAALALSRQAMDEWFEDTYEPIQSELSGLKGLAMGGDYDALYTQIWHVFFGYVTKILAEEGFTADPYSDAFRYKASLPLVWHPVLYDFDAQ